MYESSEEGRRRICCPFTGLALVESLDVPNGSFCGDDRLQPLDLPVLLVSL